MKKLFLLLIFFSEIAVGQIKIKDLPTTHTGIGGDYLLKDDSLGIPGSTKKISVRDFIAVYIVQDSGLAKSYGIKITKVGKLRIISVDTTSGNFGQQLATKSFVELHSIQGQGNLVSPYFTYANGTGSITNAQGFKYVSGKMEVASTSMITDTTLHDEILFLPSLLTVSGDAVRLVSSNAGQIEFNTGGGSTWFLNTSNLTQNITSFVPKEFNNDTLATVSQILHPGGTNTQMQYNNNGVFGGANIDYITGTVPKLEFQNNVLITGSTGNLSRIIMTTTSGGLADSGIQMFSGGVLHQPLIKLNGKSTVSQAIIQANTEYLLLDGLNAHTQVQSTSYTLNSTNMYHFASDTGVVEGDVKLDLFSQQLRFDTAIEVFPFQCLFCVHPTIEMRFRHDAVLTGQNGTGILMSLNDNTLGSGAGSWYVYDDGGAAGRDYIGIDSVTQSINIATQNPQLNLSNQPTNVKANLSCSNMFIKMVGDDGNPFDGNSMIIQLGASYPTPVGNTMFINNSDGDIYIQHQGVAPRNTFIYNNNWTVDQTSHHKFMTSTVYLTSDYVDTIQNKAGTFAFEEDMIKGAGSGTTNFLPKWTNSTTLGNSLIYDDGTYVGVGTTCPSNVLDVSIYPAHDDVNSGLQWDRAYSCTGNRLGLLGQDASHGGQISLFPAGSSVTPNTYIGANLATNSYINSKFVGIGTRFPSNVFDVSIFPTTDSVGAGIQWDREYPSTGNRLGLLTQDASHNGEIDIYPVGSSTTPTIVLNGKSTGGIQYVDGNQASGKVLMSDASGNANWSYSKNRTLFVSTSNGLDSNSTTETSIVGTGSGSMTIGANTLLVGQCIEINVRGYHNATGSPNITIKVKMGSTVIGTTGAVASGTSTNEEFEVNFKIWVRSISGSICLVSGQGQYIEGTTGASQNFFNMNNISDISFNPTISNLLDITATWGTASSNDVINGRGTLVKIHSVN